MARASWQVARRAQPPAELKLETLLQQALDDDFTPGCDVIVSYVEIPPEYDEERHWHPGEEFHCYPKVKSRSPSMVIHPSSERQGRSVTSRTASCTRRSQADKGARAIVFGVNTEGEPVRYLEEGGSDDE